MKINQPLLTVIVPCYNVEKYLDKCISSIVGQTYTNLEILLIDDGSPDNSGMICDTWQERDQRIRVIHKQNEGVACARNTGLENATADYITFVDSDDWIDENMYLNMMTALLSTHSDIAQCGVCDAYEDGRIQHRSSGYIDGSFEIIDRIKGVSLIIEDKEWKSYMGNRIFKKHLFDHLEFPKGRMQCEDVTIAHILFHRASQTVFLRDEYYFYLRRDGSITNSYKMIASKTKNGNDSYKAFYDRYCFVEQHPDYHRYLTLVKNQVILRGLRALRYSMTYPQYFSEGYSYALQKQLHAIRFKRKDMMKEVISPLMRIEISVFIINPVFYKMIVMLYAKIIHLLYKN